MTNFLRGGSVNAQSYVPGICLGVTDLILGHSQGQVDNRQMALTRYTLRQIEAFIAVAETHSFTTAGGLDASRGWGRESNKKLPIRMFS